MRSQPNLLPFHLVLAQPAHLGQLPTGTFLTWLLTCLCPPPAQTRGVLPPPAPAAPYLQQQPASLGVGPPPGLPAVSLHRGRGTPRGLGAAGGPGLQRLAAHQAHGAAHPAQGPAGQGRGRGRGRPGSRPAPALATARPQAPATSGRGWRRPQRVPARSLLGPRRQEAGECGAWRGAVTRSPGRSQ